MWRSLRTRYLDRLCRHNPDRDGVGSEKRLLPNQQIYFFHLEAVLFSEMWLPRRESWYVLEGGNSETICLQHAVSTRIEFVSSVNEDTINMQIPKSPGDHCVEIRLRSAS